MIFCVDFSRPQGRFLYGGVFLSDLLEVLTLPLLLRGSCVGLHGKRALERELSRLLVAASVLGRQESGGASSGSNRHVVERVAGRLEINDIRRWC